MAGFSFAHSRFDQRAGTDTVRDERGAFVRKGQRYTARTPQPTASFNNGQQSTKLSAGGCRNVATAKSIGVRKRLRPSRGMEKRRAGMRGHQIIPTRIGDRIENLQIGLCCGFGVLCAYLSRWKNCCHAATTELSTHARTAPATCATCSGVNSGNMGSETKL